MLSHLRSWAHLLVRLHNDVLAVEGAAVAAPTQDQVIQLVAQPLVVVRRLVLLLRQSQAEAQLQDLL